MASKWFYWRNRRRVEEASAKARAEMAPAGRPPLKVSLLTIPRLKPGRVTAAANAIAKTGELGVTGLDVRNGRVYDDYNSDMMALSDRMARYEEMRRSDTAVATIENCISLPVRRAVWHVRPAEGDESEAGKLLAARIEKNLMWEMTHSFDDLLRSGLLAILYGFTALEICWDEKPDGRIGWKKFAERARSTIYRWEFSDEGELLGLKQRGWTSNEMREMRTVTIPAEDLLLFTWRGEIGNPEGLGLLRQAWKPYNFKRDLEEFAAIRIERQAMSIPVLTPPDDRFGADAGEFTDADTAEIENMLAAASRLRVGEDAGWIELRGWRIRFEWPGPADVPFDTFIERFHQQILQTALAQFVGFSQAGDKGSFGLSKDATAFFLMTMEAAADWIAFTFNHKAIPQWVAMNTNGAVEMPRLVHGPIGTRDIAAMGNFLHSLFDLNVSTPIEQIERALEETGMGGMSTVAIDELRAAREARTSKNLGDAAPPAEPNALELR